MQKQETPGHMPNAPFWKPSLRQFHVTTTDHRGTHNCGIEYLHNSRVCGNCAHYRTADSDEWDVANYGNCMNGAGDAEPSDFCLSHPTEAEWNADVHRPHRPVLALIRVSK